MTNTTEQTDPTPNPIPAPTNGSAEPKSTRGRKLLIGAGAVLAAAVLIGGGVAVGAAIADENDDDNESTSDTTPRDGDADRADDVDRAADADRSTTTAAVGTASASELLDIIETASREADGEPVGIQAASSGSWDVQFSTAVGDESEVRVDPDGTAVVISIEPADRDDQAPSGALDAQTVDALVAAALDQVDGTVIDIEIDSDTASPYDVSVRTAGQGIIDLALDSEFAVIATDSDDSDD